MNPFVSQIRGILQHTKVVRSDSVPCQNFSLTLLYFSCVFLIFSTAQTTTVAPGSSSPSRSRPKTSSNYSRLFLDLTLNSQTQRRRRNLCRTNDKNCLKRLPKRLRPFIVHLLLIFRFFTPF